MIRLLVVAVVLLLLPYRREYDHRWELSFLERGVFIIDLPDLPGGLYFATITAAGGA